MPHYQPPVNPTSHDGYRGTGWAPAGQGEWYGATPYQFGVPTPQAWEGYGEREEEWTTVKPSATSVRGDNTHQLTSPAPTVYGTHGNRFDVLGDEGEEVAGTEDRTPNETDEFEEEMKENVAEMEAEDDKKVKQKKNGKEKKSKRKKKKNGKKKNGKPRIDYDEDQPNGDHPESKGGKINSSKHRAPNHFRSSTLVKSLIKAGSEIADNGRVDESFIQTAPVYRQQALLTSLATMKFVNRTAQEDAASEDHLNEVHQYMCTRKEDTLLEIINDNEGEVTKYHSKEIEEQRKSGVIGQQSELVCEDALERLLQNEQISGEHLADIVQAWVARFYPSRDTQDRLKMIRNRWWTKDDVKKLLAMKGSGVINDPEFPAEPISLKYDDGIFSEEIERKMDKNISALLPATLNKGAEAAYEVTIVDASTSPFIDTIPAEWMMGGVRPLSRGGVLAFVAGATVKDSILKGMYHAEGKMEPVISSITDVKETKNAKESFNVTLKSRNVEMLKRVVIYIYSTLPLLSNTAQMSSAYFEYNQELPTQPILQEERKLCTYFGVLPTDVNKRPRELYASILEGLDEALVKMEPNTSKRDRIGAGIIQTPMGHHFRLMTQPKSLTDLYKKAANQTVQYTFGTPSTRSNIMTCFSLVISNRGTREPKEVVAWVTMSRLQKLLEDHGHRCEFKDGELPEEHDLPAITKHIHHLQGEEDSDNWNQFCIEVTISYIDPRRLLQRSGIGLANPGHWFNWVYQAPLGFQWNYIQSSMQRGALLINTTALSLSNKEEMIMSLARMWRKVTPNVPKFDIDFQRVSAGDESTSVIGIYTTEAGRLRLQELVDHSEEYISRLSVELDPSLHGTRMFSLFNPDGSDRDVSTAVIQQKQYIASLDRVKLTGIDATADLNLIVPKRSNMVQGPEQNVLSVRQLLLQGSIRTETGVVVKSPIVRVGKSQTEKRWILEAPKTQGAETQSYVNQFVKHYLPQYFEGLANVRALGIDFPETLLPRQPQPVVNLTTTVLPDGDHTPSQVSTRAEVVETSMGTPVDPMTQDTQEQVSEDLSTKVDLLTNEIQEMKSMISEIRSGVGEVRDRDGKEHGGEETRELFQLVRSTKKVLEDVRQEIQKHAAELGKYNEWLQEQLVDGQVEGERILTTIRNEYDRMHGDNLGLAIKDANHTTSRIITKQFKVLLESQANMNNTVVQVVEHQVAQLNTILWESMTAELARYVPRRVDEQDDDSGSESGSEPEQWPELADHFSAIDAVVEDGQGKMDQVMRGIAVADPLTRSEEKRRPQQDTVATPAKRPVAQSVSAMSTDPPPNLSMLRRQLDEADQLQLLTNNQDSPLRECTNPEVADPQQESRTKEDEADEENSALGTDDSSVEEVLGWTCYKCDKVQKGRSGRTICPVCERFFHPECLGDHGGMSCEECHKRTESSTDSSSSDAESDESDSDESDIDEDKRGSKEGDQSGESGGNEIPRAEPRGQSMMVNRESEPSSQSTPNAQSNAAEPTSSLFKQNPPYEDQHKHPR